MHTAMAYLEHDLPPDERPKLDDVFLRAIFSHMARASAILLCILTELQAYFRFDGARINERLLEIWDVLVSAPEVKDLFDLRCAKLMQDMVFKNVPVADYTFSGDPLKIDVSYRPNGVINMIQALPLDKNIDSAKALAFSYPHVVEGIKRKEEAGTLLTAILDDDIDRNDPVVGFALAALERSGIFMAAAADLPTIAEKARKEFMTY